MPPTFKLDTFIVSLKCRTSVSAVMSRSKLTKVAAVQIARQQRACFVPADIRFPAVSLTSLDVNRKNVVFAESARSVAAVKSLTSASDQAQSDLQPVRRHQADPPVSGTEDPVLRSARPE